ncbi:hypothetical protein B1R32_105169 [Abditibacterium utsteinense]|uniref:Uncharacterized protein n=1 Tax=Abditibacterium utsteinense TaxID=1960156 RepID=A0A2S8SUK9_9BACT|nr:hypothetical protein [Abditibacterium utsteinense]PQV64487.1 hypothetical protein B1R32_105169 [Abditibacterium utsteinense]
MNLSSYFTFSELVLAFFAWNWPYLLGFCLVIVLLVIPLRRIDGVPLPFSKNEKQEEPQYRDFG